MLHGTMVLVALLTPSVGQPRNAPTGDSAPHVVVVKDVPVVTFTRQRDGSFTQVDRLRSIEYRVIRRERNMLLVNELGKEVWVDRGQVLKPEEAIVFYSELAKSNPQNARNYALRAWCWKLLGEYDLAFADYGKAIETAPAADAWYNNRGVIYAQRKKYEAALNDYNKALGINPMSGFALRNRGNVHLARKDYEKAIADYEAALGQNPGIPSTCNTLAWILATCPVEKLRNPKRALELARAANQASPQRHGQFLATLAACLAANDQFDEAVATLQQSIDAADFNIRFLPKALGRKEMYARKEKYVEKAEPPPDDE